MNVTLDHKKYQPVFLDAGTGGLGLYWTFEAGHAFLVLCHDVRVSGVFGWRDTPATASSQSDAEGPLPGSC